jgi:hypothetical protein
MEIQAGFLLPIRDNMESDLVTITRGNRAGTVLRMLCQPSQVFLSVAMLKIFTSQKRMEEQMENTFYNFQFSSIDLDNFSTIEIKLKDKGCINVVAFII